MKKLIFALLVSFANLLALFPLRAQPQADEQPEHRKNYYSCLHGYSGCDSSLLTDAERTQVSQAAHQRNFNNCLHGYSGCDSFQLGDVERTQVQQAARQRNYNNCLHGYSGCDSSQLADAERTQVQQAAHQRNFNNCLHGYSGCNSSQLTASEEIFCADTGATNIDNEKKPKTVSEDRILTSLFYNNLLFILLLIPGNWTGVSIQRTKNAGQTGEGRQRRANRVDSHLPHRKTLDLFGSDTH